MSNVDPSPNPYADQSQLASFSRPNVAARNESMVKQLPILGVLQIIMGFLELLMASLLLFSAYFVPFAIALSEKNNANAQPMPKELLSIMVYYYVIVGGMTLFFGILRMVSGVLCFFMKGRRLTLVSLIGGLATIFTFYCSLFSVGLAVYGLILLLHPAVAKAFEMAKSGSTLSQIRDHFATARFREAEGLVD